MDLSGSARAPRSPCVSSAFGCHTISWVYQFETVWAHSARTYHWGLERTWHFDTTWGSSFKQNYEDISHSFWRTSGNCSWLVGWQKKKSQTCAASLPSQRPFQQPQPCTFLPSPLLPQFPGTKNAPCQEQNSLWAQDLWQIWQILSVAGTLFRMRNTFCWTVRMNILLAFANSTASWSSLLSTRIAQLVWGLFWTSQIYGVTSFVVKCLALFPWFYVEAWIFS